MYVVLIQLALPEEHNIAIQVRPETFQNLKGNRMPPVNSFDDYSL